MKNKRLTSLAVLLMSVIIMLGTFCLPASAATSISKAKVTYETYYTYTGKEIKPKITVKVGSKKLTTKSYSVSYKDNKAVGKGYIVIKGKGSYSGTLKKGFYIQPKAVSSFKATAYSTKIKLTWSKATGAKGYQIYQFNNDSGKWVKLPTTSKTSCTVTDLDSATEYKFRVSGTPLCDPETGGPFAIAKDENEVFLQFIKPVTGEATLITSKIAEPFISKIFKKNLQ